MRALFVAAGGLDEEKRVSIANIVRLISKEPYEVKQMGEVIVKMAQIITEPFLENLVLKLEIDES